ncbi:esterase FE4-like [Ostrinia furnacalis]|uniref:esterase FE4-like n=1 Tax=Ostrinia furnacalis TaxID=93504 RepID=UPI00103ECFFF|nr:esterase FE4-like [Ostrinia furnacalis]
MYEKRIVLFTLFALNLVEQPAPEVTIEQGIVSGKINEDGTIFEYMGIPYATTNSETRFQAPLPPPKWDGVFKAVDEHHSCPQMMFIGVVGSEDCLKINVYVPTQAKKPLPVMVYIHGGAFILGSGGKLLYAPDYLVNKDVIVVTFNYRLGALGFVCLGIKEAPGNAGLKDQIAALRWVKKNIAAFGGDPDNVTLFGESAGGTSTSVLLASETTVGLFNRVIIQSGSSTSNWSVNRKPIWVASLLAKVIGHDTEDPHEIYKVLSKLPYKELVSLKPIKPLGMFFDTLLLHLPCVEKSLPGEEAVLTDLPYNLLKHKPKNIPVIYGSNSKEGLFLTSAENDTTLEERNRRYLFASDLEFHNEHEALATAARVRNFYFGEERVSHKNIKSLAKIYTDLYFEFPAAIESDLLVKHSNATVYNYFFDYSGKRNVLKQRMGYGNESGACHADDLFYLFKPRIWPFSVNEEDGKMIEWMTGMWTNFAKYGDPTPKAADIPVKWVPSTKNNLRYLYINNPMEMGPVPNPESYSLWKDIYDKYRRLDLSFYL